MIFLDYILKDLLRIYHSNGIIGNYFDHQVLKTNIDIEILFSFVLCLSNRNTKPLTGNGSM
ncbi:hypothetical protein SAMN05444371_2687 [Epilithonimonas mollis]|uniref:Uncharacterized protein n=1 Tax=Epilithonimonas mollis TaxID=216903 RepID=A0A1M6T768_9FLAO|nr:hypothetical protein SAMN05444371_2687 [Epilithonimonas mollis]